MGVVAVLALAAVLWSVWCLVRADRTIRDGLDEIDADGFLAAIRDSGDHTPQALDPGSVPPGDPPVPPGGSRGVAEGGVR